MFALSASLLEAKSSMLCTPLNEVYKTLQHRNEVPHSSLEPLPSGSDVQELNIVHFCTSAGSYGSQSPLECKQYLTAFKMTELLQKVRRRIRDLFQSPPRPDDAGFNKYRDGWKDQSLARSLLFESALW